MPVQSGPRGYDPSLTVTEKIAALQSKLALYLAKGRDGTSVVEAVRQQIATLQQHQANHVATQNRVVTTLTAQALGPQLQAVAVPGPMTAARPVSDHTIE